MIDDLQHFSSIFYVVAFDPHVSQRTFLFWFIENWIIG